MQVLEYDIRTTDQRVFWIDAPAEAEILQVGNNKLWLLVDDIRDHPTRRYFQAFANGENLPCPEVKHVSTYAATPTPEQPNPAVTHLFELFNYEPPEMAAPEGMTAGIEYPSDLAEEARPFFDTLIIAGFALTADDAWLAPAGMEVTEDHMKAVAELQEYGYGSIIDDKPGSAPKPKRTRKAASKKRARKTPAKKGDKSVH